MSYDEFKDLCRKSWEEDYNYLYIDRSKKRDQGKYCICNESKKNIQWGASITTAKGGVSVRRYRCPSL